MATLDFSVIGPGLSNSDNIIVVKKTITNDFKATSFNDLCFFFLHVSGAFVLTVKHHNWMKQKNVERSIRSKQLSRLMAVWSRSAA